MNNISVTQIETAERMAVLMVRFMIKKITPEEHEELDEWVAESDENMQLFEEMTVDKISDQLSKLLNK